MLSGAYTADTGEIWLDGEQVQFKRPQEARAMGIETVYQTLAVAPALDIATNLFLGRERAQARHPRKRCSGCSTGPGCARRPRSR